MSSLEQVIKDLEFSNQTKIRQVKDEIETIGELQKNLREKSAENVKLDKKNAKLGTETKNLHDQFTQNKDIVESLKTATTLLQKHEVDLRKNLGLKIGETERQKEENEKVLKVYHDKWIQYEQVYESDPLAKEIRAMKIHTCSLEEEAKKLEQQKEELTNKFNEMRGINDVTKEKEEAIGIIVALANMKVKSNEISAEWKKNIDMLKSMQSSNAEKQRQLVALEEELQQLKIKKQQDEMKASIAAQEQIQQQSQYQQQSQFPSSDQAPLCTRPSVTSQVPQFSTQSPPGSRQNAQVTQIRPSMPLKPSMPAQQLRMPRMPQFPKPPTLSMPKLPPVSPMPGRIPQFSFPRFQLHPLHSNKQPSLSSASQPNSSSNQQQSSQKVKSPQTLTSQKVDTVDVSGNQMTSTTSSNVDLEIESKTTPGCSTGDGVHTVELGQSLSSVMKQHGYEAANYAPPSPFTFSPGQHAQKLQELKGGISPGSSPFNQGRPMYDRSAATVEVSSSPVDSFLNSFTMKTVQFMNTDSNKAADETKVPPPNDKMDVDKLPVSHKSQVDCAIPSSLSGNPVSTQNQDIACSNNQSKNANMSPSLSQNIATSKKAVLFSQASDERATNKSSQQQDIGISQSLSSTVDSGFVSNTQQPSPSTQNAFKAPAAVGGFTFADASAPSPSQPFSFGSNPSPASNQFNFGNSDTPSPANDGFNFGVNSTTSPDDNSFHFGANVSTSAAGMFDFGAPSPHDASDSSNFAGFSGFGGDTSASATGFAFGGMDTSSDSNDASAFNFGNADASSGFSFGFGSSNNTSTTEEYSNAFSFNF